MSNYFDHLLLLLQQTYKLRFLQNMRKYVRVELFIDSDGKANPVQSRRLSRLSRSDGPWLHTRVTGRRSALPS